MSRLPNLLVTLGAAALAGACASATAGSDARLEAAVHRAAAIRAEHAEAPARRAQAVVGAVTALAVEATAIDDGRGPARLTPSTYELARDLLLDALPPGAGPLRAALAAAPAEAVAALTNVPADGFVQALAGAGAPVNAHLVHLDAFPPTWRKVLRAAHPAVVRIVDAEATGSRRAAGTGVNLAAAGEALTNAHVVGARGTRVWVDFPDGTRLPGVVTARDGVRDLATVRIEGGVALPAARLADTPPTEGDAIALIGHPGRPDGHPPPFGAIEGQILGFRTPRDGPQALGATAHDAPTDWGHSGSPLLDGAGRIVAMHNSWNPRTGTRYAISWEALTAYLAAHGPRP